MTLAVSRGKAAGFLPGDAWRCLAQAARALGWRNAGLAAGAGLLFGLAQAVHISAGGPWLNRPGARLDLFLPIVVRWVPLMTATACLTAWGLALLAQRPARGRLALLQSIGLVLVVTVVASLLVDPLTARLSQLTHVALGLPFKPFWMHMPFWKGMRLYWSIGVPATLLMASMGVLGQLYWLRARHTLQTLKAAQLLLARAQQRVLTEQLAGAQATVDPAFLFAQLQRVQAHFAQDPPRAQRLLHALIRYLRAALPARGDSACTLGQQAELLQAYVELESVASGDRLRMRVEMRSALAQRPIAPQLLLPLVANAVQHGIGPGRTGEIVLRVAESAGGLLIAVDDDGRGRVAQLHEAAGLAGVRQRLATLYGGHSRLSLRDRQPAGLSAQLDIDTRSRP